jgi:hypothetical protein
VNCGSGVPSWVTLTGWPAIVTVVEREVEGGFADVARTCTVPGPVPEVGSTVAQPDPAAVQAHPLGMVTTTSTARVASAGMFPEGEETDGQQAGLPAWVTFTVWPATVTLTLRGEVAELELALIAAEPDPGPVAGPTVAQLLPWVVHPQPGLVVTLTFAEPVPSHTKSTVVGDTTGAPQAAAWVTCTDLPATVIFTERVLVAVFGELAVTRTRPLPEADAGLT